MKRDWDLIRQILFALRDIEPGGEIDFEGFECSDPMLHDHLRLLTEAGLINAIDVSAMDSYPEYVPRSLTWSGHEFLDDIQNESVWTQVKSAVVQHGGSASIAVLHELAKTYVKDLFKLA